MACWKTRLIGSLWYEMEILGLGITLLKSAALMLLKLCACRYYFGISNELLIIIIAQEAAKLWPVKVGGPKKDSSPDPFEPLFTK